MQFGRSRPAGDQLLEGGSWPSETLIRKRRTSLQSGGSVVLTAGAPATGPFLQTPGILASSPSPTEMSFSPGFSSRTIPNSHPPRSHDSSPSPSPPCSIATSPFPSPLPSHPPTAFHKTTDRPPQSYLGAQKWCSPPKLVHSQSRDNGTGQLCLRRTALKEN